MYKTSSSWVDLHAEYKESYGSLEELKRRRTETASLEDTVDCQIAGSMMGELAATIKELKNRSLYEFNSISVEDIFNPAYGLTERQKEIALLRLDYSCKEIAEILHVEQCTVFNIHTTSVNKIIYAKSKEKQDLVADLSKQQNEILVLMNKGLKNKEIALQLGITESTVKVQKNRIRKRLTKP